MVLLDLSQILYASLHAAANFSDLDEKIIRHVVLNVIRSNKVKFSRTYGELIICADSPNNWRKDHFPYYKAARKAKRDARDIDWNKIFPILNTIRAEISETFSYRFISVDKAEGDDLIAVLAAELAGSPLATLIISSDHDFVQLHKFDNVSQYDPVRKKWVSGAEIPTVMLQKHIIKGDPGDGIPNILSADDSFVTGTRQKPISSKKMEGWAVSDPVDWCNQDMLRNYHRNKLLIDFSMIPDTIRLEVLDQFEKQQGKKSKDLFGYFIKNRLNGLLESINDF